MNGDQMKHEQSYADAFREHMKQQAISRNCYFHAFSVDGQDRDLRGDYIISDSDRFALVEFKYGPGTFEVKDPKMKDLGFAICCRRTMQ